MSQTEEIIHTLFGRVFRASAEEVHAQWKAFRLRHHPDKGGNKDIFVAGKRAYDLFLQKQGIWKTLLIFIPENTCVPSGPNEPAALDETQLPREPSEASILETEDDTTSEEAQDTDAAMSDVGQLCEQLSRSERSSQPGDARRNLLSIVQLCINRCALKPKKGHAEEWNYILGKLQRRGCLLDNGNNHAVFVRCSH